MDVFKKMLSEISCLISMVCEQHNVEIMEQSADIVFDKGLSDLLINDVLAPLKLCHYLMVTGGFKYGTERLFGRRCAEDFA